MITTFNNPSIGSQVLSTRGTKVVAVQADERKPLPRTFQPGPYDVICARGKTAASHNGNVLFRRMIKARLVEYSSVKSRIEKSLIVSSIVDSVRESSHGGGFVKQNRDKVWFEVGDTAAREKVGQGFRDLLHTKYRSSYQAKQRLKKGATPEISSPVKPTLVAFPKVSTALPSQTTSKSETQRCESYDDATKTFIESCFASRQSEEFDDLLNPLTSPCNLESIFQDRILQQTLKQLATMPTDFKPIFSKTPSAKCVRSHAA